MIKRIVCHTENMGENEHDVRYYVQPYENSDGNLIIYMHGFIPWVLKSVYEVKRKSGLFARMTPIPRPTFRLLFNINGRRETLKVIAPAENDKVIFDLIVTLKLAQDMVGVNVGKITLDEPLKKFMKGFNEDKARQKILGARNPRCFYETGGTVTTEEIYIRHFVLSGVIGDGEKSIIGVYIGDTPDFSITEYMTNIQVGRTAVDDYNCAVVINEEGCKIKSLPEEELDKLNGNIEGW